MKHILLCGNSGVGKTTLMHRLVKDIGLPICGYLSQKEKMGEDGVSEVYIHEQGKPLSFSKDNLVGRVGRSVWEAYPFVFDAFAERLRALPKDGIILLDEIGILEQDAHVFQKAIFTLLDGAMPVIAAVKNKKHPYLDAVLAHPKCSVYTVTVENRDSLYESLSQFKA